MTKKNKPRRLTVRRSSWQSPTSTDYVKWDIASEKRRLQRGWRCKKKNCFAHVGAAFVDPDTGEFDHSRITCLGEDEDIGAPHEIIFYGDMVAAEEVLYIENQNRTDFQEMVFRLPFLDSRPKIDPDVARKNLYGDDDFEGFD